MDSDFERRIDLIQLSIKCLEKLCNSPKLLKEIMSVRQLSQKLIQLLKIEEFEIPDPFFCSSLIILFQKIQQGFVDFSQVEILIDSIFRIENLFELVVGEILNLIIFLISLCKVETVSFFKKKKGFLKKLKEIQRMEEIDSEFSSNDLEKIIKILS
jgi:hypothetical protein